MNAVTGFVAIVSLLLALATAGDARKDQAKVDAPPRNITPSKIAINHNETMVRDATSVQQPDAWAEWWTNVQDFVFANLITYDLRDKGGCDDWGCGTNHNETMVSDEPVK